MNIGQRVTYKDDFFDVNRREGTITDADNETFFVRWDRAGETIFNPGGPQVISSGWEHESQLALLDE